MNDVAPELLEAVKTRFTKKESTDTILEGLKGQIQKGTATYKEATHYAQRLGELLAESLQQEITADSLPDGRMYYNIARRVLEPMLSDNYRLAVDAAADVQESMNRAAGLRLKAAIPDMSVNRVMGIIEKASSSESFEDVSWVLGEPVVNFTMSAVDDTLRENVEFQGEAGLEPTVDRIAEAGCCDWCARLEGIYRYPVEREVYRRHEYCRCIVLFNLGNGKSQNVHTKIVYNSAAKAKRDSRIARIQELEKGAAQKRFLQSVENRPELLSKYSPEEMKKQLENLGADVKPLGHGSLKGLSFEEGGGYRVNYDDGGLLQYHPETKSHHQGAYYKISSNQHGIHRYNLKGEEIDVAASQSTGKQIIR